MMGLWLHRIVMCCTHWPEACRCYWMLPLRWLDPSSLYNCCLFLTCCCHTTDLAAVYPTTAAVSAAAAPAAAVSAAAAAVFAAAAAAAVIAAAAAAAAAAAVSAALPLHKLALMLLPMCMHVCAGPNNVCRHACSLAFHVHPLSFAANLSIV